MSTQAGDGLTCRVIEDLAAWQALQPAWDALLEASVDATPWQSWDFLTAWWRNMSGANRLRVVVVERDGVPCLVMPLQISRWPWLPGFPVYILEPIGSIMDVNRPRISLGAPDAAVFALALEELWRRRDEWHLIRVDEKLEDDTEALHLRAFAARHALGFRQAFSHLCPYLDLRQSWTSYVQGRSVRLRKNLRAARRRLEALGPVTLRTFHEPQEIEGAFAMVLDLYARSWKRRKKVEHGNTAGYRRFFASWLQSMASRGRARVLALYCGSRPVAATVAFSDATTYYSAQIVHDAQFAQCSPGTLLEAAELEGLMQEQRYATYDFLGSFLNNKLRWTDTALRTTHVFVMQPSLRMKLIDGYYFRVKPFVKPRLVALLRRLRGKA